MAYYIDLEKISLNEYEEKLATAYLPPSRQMLRERCEERFGCFKKVGIENVKQLQQALEKKEKMESFSKIECLSDDYLKILLRELNSLLPKPNRLKEFTGIDEETVEKLEKLGIKNTVKLFDEIIDPEKRQELVEKTGLSKDKILELTKLTDLSRIRWVGTTFARMLYDLGVDTVEKSANANPEKLHNQLNQLNKEKGFFKGYIGLNDIRIFVETAKDVPQDIIY